MAWPEQLVSGRGRSRGPCLPPARSPCADLGARLTTPPSQGMEQGLAKELAKGLEKGLVQGLVAASSPPIPRAAWPWVAWLTVFWVGTDLFIVAPMLVTMGKDLHRDATSLRACVSTFSLSYALAAPLMGRMAESWGLRRQLSLGLLVLALGNAWSACAQGLLPLLIARALAGLGAASTTPLLYALVAQHAPPQQRAGVLARVNSGLLSALALGAPMGVWALPRLGWRASFAALSLACLLCLLCNRRVWPKPPAPVKAIPPTATPGAQPLPLSLASQAFAAAATPEIRAAGLPMLITGLWSASVYAIYLLLSTALHQQRHLDNTRVASFLCAYGIGAALGSLGMGELANRWGAARMATLSLAWLCGMQVLLGLHFASASLPLLWAMLLGLAWSAYGIFPALQACLSERVVQRRASALGWMSSSLYLGMAVGERLGSLCFAQGGMARVAALACFLSLAALALTWRLWQGPRQAPA